MLLYECFTARALWRQGVGFSVDYNKDGYALGAPTKFSGDYFLPGSPVEGFVTSYKVPRLPVHCVGTLCEWLPVTLYHCSDAIGYFHALCQRTRCLPVTLQHWIWCDSSYCPCPPSLAVCLPM